MAYKRVYDTYNERGRFVCDTVADIATLPGVGSTPIGSRAFVTEGSLRYVLVPSGRKPIYMGSGGESGGGDTPSAGGVISLDNNQITDPEWLRESSDGIYYGTIDNKSAYTWPYGDTIPEGAKYPVFMEVRSTKEGVKFFECHSNEGEFQSIYDPSMGTTITFINIAGGMVIFEDLG